MNVVAAILILSAAGAEPVAAQVTDTVRISGRVTDFDHVPVEGATVLLKDHRFQDVATAVTDADGGYVLTAPSGHYMALMAVKDYRTRNLQFWAWNVPAVRDVVIDPRFHKLEVYALNAWRPQGAYPSYQIYFRPMSLSRAMRVVADHGMEALSELPILDIAPALTAEDIDVTIAGQPVEILEVNRIRESAGPGQAMFGYVIQVTLPAERPSGEHIRFSVVVRDRETEDVGEAWLWIRNMEEEA